jgi:uncharacterized protein
MSEVVDNKDASRFELEVEGELAILEYRIQDGAIHFTHTETPPHLQGRGIAGRIAHAALLSARERGLKPVPRCSYMVDYLTKHPELQS